MRAREVAGEAERIIIIIIIITIIILIIVIIITIRLANYFL